MNNNKIECLANIKEIRTKTLVSGDKEIRITLSIIGEDIAEANKLNELAVDKQVKIIGNWEE